MISAIGQTKDGKKEENEAKKMLKERRGYGRRIGRGRRKKPRREGGSFTSPVDTTAKAFFARS